MSKLEDKLYRKYKIIKNVLLKLEQFQHIVIPNWHYKNTNVIF